jgi:hypothetical protein
MPHARHVFLSPSQEAILMKCRSQTAALLLSVLALAFGWAGAARAQGVTTSAIAGTVTGPAGQPLGGAQVLVTNSQTGAMSRVVTRSNGRFLIQGLQPGGPYRVNVSLLGYAPVSRAGLSLALGTTQDLDIQLQAQAVTLEGLTVQAERGTSVISRSRTGTTTVVGDSAIRRTPTITRDFTDLTRLVPQVNVSGSGTSGGGRNNRFNNIQIDGAANNDLFGLAASGTPGGQAGTKPITLEAIQEFQVVLAPFDVRQGGFTGLGVNAVTRSGTNDFHGSLAYYAKNQDLTGRFRLDNGNLADALSDFSQKDFAASFGGPIIRDRAFFFLAVEPDRRTSPVNTIVGQTTGSNDVTEAQVREVATILQNQYGYDPGEIFGFGLRRESDNVFGRLDVNLSANNRLTLRHNYVNAFDDNFSRTGGSGGSTSGYTLGGGGYEFHSKTNSTVLQLNSTLPRGLYNELRVNFTTVRDARQVADAFPRVYVSYGTNQIIAGTEEFSGANSLNQDIFEVVNDLTLSAGSHNFTLGTSNEFSSFENLFVRNAFGAYRFTNVDSLRAGRPRQYDYSFLLPGGNEQAEFDVRRHAFYLQDKVDVRENLQFTLGLRADLTRLPTGIAQNDSVVKYYGRSTSNLPESTLQFNPRLGFNWDVRNDQSTQVRGGLGLFSGRAPYVWISNAYGNNGLDYVRFTCTNSATQRTPNFVADPANQPRNCVGTTLPAANEINLVDPDLKLPQVWRASLAVDRRLPMGLIGTLEGLYTGTVQDLVYQNLAIEAAGDSVVEGRQRYHQRYRSGTGGIGQIYEVTNADEGHTYNLTAQLQKPFSNGWEFSLAYTFSQAFDKAPLTSSQASSNWINQTTSNDPNNPDRAHADFEVPHRILLNVSKQYQFLRRAPTDLSVVYVGQSGRPFSFRYNGDVNFDGSFANDLVYVPASSSEIIFVPGTVSGRTVSPAESWQNLDKFINSLECLDDARGQVMERNTCREPWSSRIDLRLAQTVPTFRGHGMQVTLDVFNFGNLLNNRWGRDRFINFNTFNLLAVTGSTTTAEGRRTFLPFTSTAENIFSTSNLNSRYQIQLGARYNF